MLRVVPEHSERSKTVNAFFRSHYNRVMEPRDPTTVTHGLL